MLCGLSALGTLTTAAALRRDYWGEIQGRRLDHGVRHYPSIRSIGRVEHFSLNVGFSTMKRNPATSSPCRKRISH